MIQYAAGTTTPISKRRLDTTAGAQSLSRQATTHRCAVATFALGTGLWLLGSAAWAAEAGAAAHARGKLWVTPIEYVECTSETAFARGDTVMLTGSGLLPNEAVEITFLQGAAEHSLGATKANAIGALNARFPIPTDALTDQEAQFRASAEHGANGGGVQLSSSPLQIFADNRDSDGDGVKDMCDTCPNLASEDSIDMDADGLGDACDPCPTDPENGAAGNGKCADDNPNPLVPLSQPRG